MRRSELIRRLDRVPAFPDPRPELEQVRTPPEAAAEMLWAALGAGELEGRAVADLGCGTGVLALGAALLGARSVEGWDVDARALALGRDTAQEWGVEVRFVERSVEPPGPVAETILMNPPFGAQRAQADRPFWEAALGGTASAVYAFALADSRSFIERQAVAHSARLDERRPIDWTLPATFRHHRRRNVPLKVDLWVLRRGSPP